MSSRPPVRNVIGVLRSLTTSATSASLNRTAATPSAPGSIVNVSPASASVHSPEGVTNENGATPSSRAPGTREVRVLGDELRELLLEERTGVDRGDVVVGAGPEIERDHREVVPPRPA